MEEKKKNSLSGKDLENVSGGIALHYPSSHDDDTLTPIEAPLKKPKPHSWSPKNLPEE